jgi:hypothetical protein
MITCGSLGGRKKDGTLCAHPAGWGLAPEFAGQVPCMQHCPDPVSLIRSRHQRAFLAAYVTNGNISRSATAAGVGRGQHYDWLKDDPSYRPRFEDAEEQAADLLEMEARRRAIAGLRRYKFDRNGKALASPETGEAYYELEYSDMLLMQLLKANRPEKFRERQSVEHSGPGGKPIEVREVSDDDLRRRAAELTNRVAALAHVGANGNGVNGNGNGAHTNGNGNGKRNGNGAHP